MTATMLERARASAREMGFDHAELHESLIESLPIEDESVDVVISTLAQSAWPSTVER